MNRSAWLVLTLLAGCGQGGSDWVTDGLPVEAVARRRDDMMSIRQVGPIVELERIRAR
ncbi:MAG: hypothetical protein ACREOQ_21860 [Gemmatimonadales bacterium]